LLLLATSFPNPFKSRADIFMLHQKFICGGNIESQGAKAAKIEAVYANNEI
jgi:hypothetical protein